MENRGTPSNLGLDPTGTRTKFVPVEGFGGGGDLNNLQNRIQSFSQIFYSHSRYKNADNLARAGFYYLEYKDYTKCFNCGMGVNDWGENDNPSNSYFHGQGCRFVSNSVQSGLNESGFASISGNSPSSSINHQHSNTQSAMLMTPRVTNPSSTFTSSHQPSGSTDEPFPCLHPTNPNMKNFSDRKRTFSHASWAQHFNINVDALASAGFYCFDGTDKAKCFYCNGGLQSWQRDNDPWIEHAKWFPNCEHVLKNKGLEFVSNIPREQQNQETTIPREVQRSTPREVQRSTPREVQRSTPQEVQSQPMETASVTPPPGEPITNQTQATENVMSKLLAQQALDMGFSERLIKHAYHLQRITKNSSFDTLASMLEVLLQLEEDEQTHAASI